MNEGPKIEEAKKLLSQVPKKIFVVTGLASLVGILFLARFCWSAHEGKISPGKAFFYGLLILSTLFLNSSTLINRSRSGYIVVGIVSALSLPGILAQSFHLVVQTLHGGWANDSVGLVACLLAAFQLISTATLYLFLLSREVRDYVWTTAKASE
ncbi:MAG: hypothetical protein JWN25_3226 [Verrucomicrobiales bacterium]|nr:hypothetical protein [Verrucomicrobiales bacterium]